MGVTITWAISCGLESSKLQLQLFQAANNWPLFPPALLLTPSYKEGRALATPHKKLPLFTELPRRLILGNSWLQAPPPTYRLIALRAVPPRAPATFCQDIATPAAMICYEELQAVAA